MWNIYQLALDAANAGNRCVMHIHHTLNEDAHMYPATRQYWPCTPDILLKKPTACICIKTGVQHLCRLNLHRCYPSQRCHYMYFTTEMAVQCWHYVASLIN